MADLTFNTKENQTIDRHLLVLFLNTGENEAPVWSPVGRSVSDSSMELDWGEESSTDILGNTNITMNKPKITQSFDPWNLDSGDKAQLKIWNAAVRDQDANALANMDMLVVHFYAGMSDTAAFAERYTACGVKPNSLGGAGGGKLGMSVDVTYGGTRTIGTAAVEGGKITFTAE